MMSMRINHIIIVQEEKLEVSRSSEFYVTDRRPISPVIPVLPLGFRSGGWKGTERTVQVGNTTIDNLWLVK